MKSLLISYLVLSRPIGYLVIFLGMMIEGDVSLFVGTFLTQQGFFEWGVMLPLAFAGFILGDTLWYFAGRQLRNRKSVLNDWIERVLGAFDDHLLEQPLHTIFVAKFIYGLHRLMLVQAGRLRLPFPRFLKYDILSTIPWFALVAVLGYLSSYSLASARHYLKFVEIPLLIAVVVFVLLDYSLAKGLKKKLK